MRKRLRFGIVIGLAVVILAIAAYAGSGRFTRASSNALPGSNCSASPDAVVNITISQQQIISTLGSFSPGICFRFLIQNNDQQAYDLLIQQPGSDTVLAGASNIGAGQMEELDYQFDAAPSGTPVDFVCVLTGQQNALSTHEFYLAK